MTHFLDVNTFVSKKCKNCLISRRFRKAELFSIYSLYLIQIILYLKSTYVVHLPAAATAKCSAKNTRQAAIFLSSVHL